MLSFLIPDDQWCGGRERREDIRRANRSSSTKVEDCVCNSQNKAGETNKARDDKDEPLQERSGVRSHLWILVGVNLISACDSLQSPSSVDPTLVQQGSSEQNVQRRDISDVLKQQIWRFVEGLSQL